MRRVWYPGLMRSAVFLFLCACLYGCGDDGATPVADANVPAADANATADAVVTPDARTTGSVTVNVLNQTPNSGIAVMYADAAGAHTGTMTTDANGTVVITDMPLGGFVTVALGSTGFYSLRTVSGVEDGDVLNLGQRIETLGTQSLLMTNTGALGGTSYGTNQRCGSGGGGSPVDRANDLTSDCLNAEGKLDALGIVNGGGVVVAYSPRTDVAISGTAPNQTAAVLYDTWEQSFGSVQLDYNNDSGASEDVALSVYGYRTGHAFNTAEARATLANSESAFRALSVVSFFDRAVTQVTTGTSSLSTSRAESRAIPGTGVTTTVTLASSDLLPVLSGASLDAGARTLTTGLAALPTCGANAATYVHGWWGGQVNADTFEWSMVSPAATSVTFPELDPTLTATFWPATIVLAWGQIDLVVAGSDYAAIRSTGLEADSVRLAELLGPLGSDASACFVRADLTP